LTRRISRVLLLGALLFVTLLRVPAAAVTAQGDPVAILKQVPGLKAAYARKYISTDQATPALPGGQRLTVTATALEFTSAFQLALAVRVFINDATIHEMLGEPTGTVTKTAASSVGPNAEIYLVRTDIGDGQALALLFAHHGALAVLIRADGPEVSLTPALVAVGTFMVNARPGSGAVILRPPAQSTGGLWNLFPSAKDTGVLHGLAPAYDYDLLGPTGDLPIGTATPAS
jgi:hypothetical protein